MSDALTDIAAGWAQTPKTCTTCGHYTDKPVNTHDQQTGTYQVCKLDQNHPGARFANPGLPCRLDPAKWTRK